MVRKRKVELTLYALTTVSVLPLTLVEARTLFYFLLNPEMIKVRDAALEFPLVGMTLNFALIALLLALLPALFVLAVGTRQARIGLVLISTAMAFSVLIGYFGSSFPFTSMSRVVLENISVLFFFFFSATVFIYRWKYSAAE